MVMPGTLRQAENVEAVVAVGVAVDRVGEGFLADEAEALGPNGVWRDRGGVLDREQVRAGGELLREVADLADGEGSEGRIVLKIIFAGEAIAAVEVVVDVAVDLVGFEGGLGTENERVVAEIAVEIVFRRDEELAVGKLEVHDFQRVGVDVARRSEWCRKQRWREWRGLRHRDWCR